MLVTANITKSNFDKIMELVSSYLDLINFLNENFNYGSTKLGWKLIAAKIVSTLGQSPEEFFNKEFPLFLYF